MKRLMLFLTAVLLLAALLTGCDLKNRQDSRNFVPTGGSKETKATEPRQTKPDEPVIIPTPVKEIKTVEGTFSAGGDSVTSSYRLPYLDLSGAHAVGCNAEIEADFGEAIRAAEKAMAEGELPELTRIGYETWQYDNILCLQVFRIEIGTGKRTDTVYTVNALSGEAAAASDLLMAAGVNQKKYPQLLRAAAEQFYEDTFAAGYSPEDIHYNEGKSRTLEAGLLNTAVPASLTEDGELVVVITVIDPTGTVSTARITVPAA